MLERNLVCVRHDCLLNVRGVVMGTPQLIGGEMIATRSISIVSYRGMNTGTGLIIICECPDTDSDHCEDSWHVQE